MKTMLIYLFTFLTLFACKNDDDQPVEAPPITAENTFSCKIDGELFIPEDYASFPNNFDAYNVFFIEANSSWFSLFLNEERSIHIYIHDLINVGTYTIGDADGNNNFTDETTTVIEFSENQSLEPTHISTSASGTIEVLELEFGRRIIFKFDEIVLQRIGDPSDIITLTDGKANFNLDTFNN
mgnify:CR=1 FL=1|tara:strand:- start:141717 stop:142262 length:546 start_codon:yes stop_codon:yes gene_type:complete